MLGCQIKPCLKCGERLRANHQRDRDSPQSRHLAASCGCCGRDPSGTAFTKEDAEAAPEGRDLYRGMIRSTLVTCFSAESGGCKSLLANCIAREMEEDGLKVVVCQADEGVAGIKRDFHDSEHHPGISYFKASMMPDGPERVWQLLTS